MRYKRCERCPWRNQSQVRLTGAGVAGTYRHRKSIFQVARPLTVFATIDEDRVYRTVALRLRGETMRRVAQAETHNR
jgi:hypothetical protein